VVVRGGGPLGARAADLLHRAGVTPTDDPHGADAAVLLGAYDPAVGAMPVLVATLGGRAATLTVLPGGSCTACAPRPAAPNALGDALAICTAHALAALAASETLLTLLDAGRPARRYTLDTGTGTFQAEPLPATCRHGSPSR
jgi:hypothetical protein